ncbi:hypothetical protein VCHA54O485_100117 [Vibrio chagasii]|nr:hypothetical protein VCHA54O485_100117 [Vibrio chagasii]
MDIACGWKGVITNTIEPMPRGWGSQALTALLDGCDRFQSAPLTARHELEQF